MSSLVATQTTPPDLSRTVRPGQDPQQLRDQLKRLFDQPELLPDKLLGFLVDYLAVNQPMIPISSIFGFFQFTGNFNAVYTRQTTASASYTNLATTGPTLSNLADGNYAIIHGCLASNNTAAQQAYQSVSINAGAAIDNNSCRAEGTTDISVMTLVVSALSAGANSIQCKYKVSGGTGAFDNRFLFALRYANL